MSDYQSAFSAPFQIVEIRNRRTDRSPSHSVVFNFTREEAVKAAQWFMQMAERVDTDNTTCSIWNSDTKSADEHPGFAVWASLWGKSGRMSPPVPTTVTDGSASSKELPF